MFQPWKQGTFLENYMKSFNAFQMVAFFAAAPFGLSWLSEAAFKGASIAFWVAVLSYCVGFVMLTVAVRVGIEEL